MNNAGQSVEGMVILAAIAVLVLLIVAIRMYAKLQRAQGRHEAAASEAAPAAQAERVQPVVDEGIAPEIVAAIAAAIAALGAGHKPLVVRSIRRADGWSKSARTEQIYRF